MQIALRFGLLILALCAFAIPSVAESPVSGCNWVVGGCGDSAAATGTRAFFEMKTSNNSEAMIYTTGSGTAIHTIGTNWAFDANSIGFTGDTAGDKRGQVTYTGADTITVQCILGSAYNYDNEQDDVGEDVIIAMSRNDSGSIPTSKAGPIVLLAAQAYGIGVSSAFMLQLDQNDTLNLRALGYATAGEWTPEILRFQCEEPGSDGAPGVDADFGTDGPTNVATLAGAMPVVNKTGNATLSTLELSGSVLTNKGAVGPIILTLGTGTCDVGRNFSVLLYETQYIELNPFAGDHIVNLTDTINDYLRSDTSTATTGSFTCVATGKWLGSVSTGWTEQ